MTPTTTPPDHSSQDGIHELVRERYAVAALEVLGSPGDAAASCCDRSTETACCQRAEVE